MKKSTWILVILIIIILSGIHIKSLSQNKNTPDCIKIINQSKLNQLENLQVFFNDAKHQKSNNINLILACYFDQAQISIDAHFYQANDQIILKSLINAKKRGVKIRFITDDNYYNDARYYPIFYTPLMKNNIPVIHDQKTPHTDGQSHHKFAIIDQKSVWTGSYNITENGAFNNSNNALIMHSVDIANTYLTEFNEMWGSNNEIPDFSATRFGNQKLQNTKSEHYLDGVGKIEICFDPSDNCQQKILKTLQTADFSIDFAVFSLTDDFIGDLLSQKYLSGLSGSGIFHRPEQPYGEYTKLKKTSPNNMYLRTELTDIPRLIHHKFFIIDAESNSDPIVITGSRNFSQSSNTKNDENTVIIHNKQITQMYKEEINRLISN